ncbi:Protein of uncharacterised function (DUF3800) [Mycobacteroides abscessus subsp. massiliense]|uniref:DUF3800 domain-containing protein n=1 Tax=Mycobacteroides abscessus TaxID=36809 RepID=UPI0003641B5C|nr:DUF3800 domain-containing protein [Mycobacteroides abscessus]ANN97524.1 hypothetical protein BAB74_01180 [Mycobacteroides abscessus]SLE88795.1 Protein of uncharacterised function (DUF3800) [Mycobacteroides abscessus subsp. massiliense]SLH29484.1 Protein of uncharacterised function (DUF3800) [Mycobacteroides abscessus subsp. massiliense]
MRSQPHVWAYIDETGDRGIGSASSPVFGMAAVLVTDSGAVQLRQAVMQLRSDFSVPANKVMSWKDYAKTHDRRKHAVEILGAVQDLKVCYVYAVKKELDPASYINDRERFYNYVAYKTYKSVIWAARNWQGQSAKLWTRFGHVRRHDHRSTESYIQWEASQDPRVPFQMEQGLRWVSADQYLESQAADLYGGFLKSAIWPSGEFNYVEPRYLLDIWRQIRNSEDCVIPLGMMSMPDNGLTCKMHWFPCSTCPKK